MTELVRYALNGVVATAAHYCVLFVSLELLDVRSAGLSNLGASCVGIFLSFIGNRYFVFRSIEEALLRQMGRFSFLYSLITLVHGGVMFVWADLLALSYSTGFIVAVIIQLALGYLGNRRFVFIRDNQCQQR